MHFTTQHIYDGTMYNARNAHTNTAQYNTFTSLAPHPWKLRELPSNPCMITTGFSASGPAVRTPGLKSMKLSLAAPPGRAVLGAAGGAVESALATMVVVGRPLIGADEYDGRDIPDFL